MATKEQKEGDPLLFSRDMAALELSEHVATHLSQRRGSER